MTCIYCKGNIEQKYTNFIVDLNNTIIIIKDVPSEVCTQCGEVSYSNEVAERLEQIVARMKQQDIEIVVTHYTEQAA